MENNTLMTKITSLLLLIALLLLSGCGSSFFKGKTDVMVTYDFQKGTEGIKMEFIEEMPPKQLFMGTEFATGLRLKNMGSYDISSDSEIKLSVPDTSAFNIKENPQNIELKGKSLYLKEGEENIFTFPMKALCFPGYEEQIVRNYTRKIKATLCYYYETSSNVDLCVDTRKFLRQKGEKVECQMKDVTLSGGQGGPVGLTRISPALIPQSDKEVTVQISLSIDKLQGLEHQVYAPEAGCNDPKEQNKVAIEVQMGNQPLQCEPSIIMIKENSVVSSVCKRKVDANLGAFSTPVTVKMKYYVQQNALKELTVEPPPGQRINCAALRGGTGGAASAGGSDECSSAHPGYSCRTISCESGQDEAACISSSGCYTGLCPGGAYNICCP